MARLDHDFRLRHFVECHLAARLVAAGDGGLRLVATHVSAQRVPSTPESLAALLGRAALSGVLCEPEPRARPALEEAWHGTAVRIEGRNWREALADGALFPPTDLARPWLVAMDPERWLLDGEAKKEARGPYLVREDLETLRPLLAAHVKSGLPGAFAAFAYGADPQHAKGFRSHTLRLADRLGLERVVLGIDGEDATRHVGIVMTSLVDLAADTAEAWHAFQAEG